MIKTAITVANVTGLPVERARASLEKLADLGYLKRLGIVDGEQQYIISEDGVMYCEQHPMPKNN